MGWQTPSSATVPTASFGTVSDVGSVGFRDVPEELRKQRQSSDRRRRSHGLTRPRSTAAGGGAAAEQRRRFACRAHLGGRADLLQQQLELSSELASLQSVEEERALERGLLVADAAAARLLRREAGLKTGRRPEVARERARQLPAWQQHCESPHVLARALEREQMRAQAQIARRRDDAAVARLAGD